MTEWSLEFGLCDDTMILSVASDDCKQPSLSSTSSSLTPLTPFPLFELWTIMVNSSCNCVALVCLHNVHIQSFWLLHFSDSFQYLGLQVVAKSSVYANIYEYVSCKFGIIICFTQIHHCCFFCQDFCVYHHFIHCLVLEQHSWSSILLQLNLICQFSYVQCNLNVLTHSGLRSWQWSVL